MLTMCQWDEDAYDYILGPVVWPHFRREIPSYWYALVSKYGANSDGHAVKGVIRRPTTSEPLGRSIVVKNAC